MKWWQLSETTTFKNICTINDRSQIVGFPSQNPVIYKHISVLYLHKPYLPCFHKSYSYSFFPSVLLFEYFILNFLIPVPHGCPISTSINTTISMICDLHYIFLIKTKQKQVHSQIHVALCMIVVLQIVFKIVISIK